jgi:phosphoribosylanthranilate isomerase
MRAADVIRVKVCCVMSLEEAWRAVRAGASALGLVSEMPSGPGVIPERLIAAIASTVPPPIATFLLTSLTDVAAIVDQHGRCPTTTIQLCDRLRSGTHGDLRHALPGIGLVQVVHVTGPEAIEFAREAAADADALLLDSGRPAAGVRELGGTGRTHDWETSRRIREEVDVPVFLAGGLDPENVHDAIRTVGPFGVDVCSGVRTAGRLDGQKVDRFLDNARARSEGES